MARLKKSLDGEFWKKWKEDEADVLSVVQEFDRYSAELKKIRKEKTDETTINWLLNIYDETEFAFEVLEKYENDRKFSKILPGPSEKLKKVKSLEQLVFNSIESSANDIKSQWNRAKKDVERWKPKYGVEDIVGARGELDNAGELYFQLIEGLGVDNPDMQPIREDTIERYSAFIQDVRKLDPKLDEIKDRTKNLESLTKERVHVLERDFDDLFEKYEKIKKKHTTLRERRSKKSIFAYKEKFIELEDVRDEIYHLKHNYDFIHTAKAKIGEFVDHYHEVLDVLNDKYHIDLDFVHWIKSIKLTEPDFLHSVSDIAHLAYDVTQLTTLEGLVKKGIEIAMNAIDGHLDHKFNEAKDIYHNHEDHHHPSILETAVNILDEIAVIYKVIDGSTQAVENLKSQIKNKKDYHDRQLKNKSGGIAKVVKETKVTPSLEWLNQVKVEKQGFFDITGYMNELGGAPANYCILRNTLFGNGNWIDRVERVGELIEDLPLAGDSNELEYITSFEQGLHQTYASGIVGDMARKNSSYNERATAAIGKLHDYVENSKEKLNI